MNNRFVLLILIRLIAIIGGVLLMVALWGNPDLVFTRLLIGLLVVGMVVNLLHFVNRTNQELNKFLDAIAYDDRSVNFSLAKLGGSFRRLQDNFKEILHSIQEAKIAKEAQLGFLQVLLEQIPVGVIAVRDQETVELMNNRAAALLHTGHTHSWSLLQRIRPEFCAALEGPNVPAHQTITLNRGRNEHQLVVDHHRIKLLEIPYTIITFQDIREELEQQEMQAWQKLIRILTHEIMNSITPLSSLTDTLLLMLHPPGGEPKLVEELRQDDLEDMRYSLVTIRDRSEGLLKFVDDYRRLYKVPTPQKRKLHVAEFMGQVYRLMRAPLEQAGCTWELHIHPQDLSLQADENQLQQVLINLITNALQAQIEVPKPHISVRVFVEKNRLHLAVSDRGPGIDPDKLDKIFVPFFTTKSDGSGIGLSLSRQIMYLHQGQLRAQNLAEGGALFTLIFPPEQHDNSVNTTG